MRPRDAIEGQELERFVLNQWATRCEHRLVMKTGDLIGGKYRLTGPLGEGAMGTVWEARNERTGKAVALKLMLKPTPDRRERLLREARACGGLTHPNIVELYDVGETESGEPFLVLQRLSGQTLAEFLNSRHRLEPVLAARIGRDIANALAAAHAKKIVHRDLKPANVFLHRDDSLPEGEFLVKVLDFGVSKDLNADDAPATATGIPIGSPAYMSPEQVSAAKDIDTRTDIWSLGILMYELIVGMRPFDGTVQDVVRHILAMSADRISSRVRHVPPALDDLIARCLERDRDKRWQTAGEVAQMLGVFIESSVAKVGSDQNVQGENPSEDEAFPPLPLPPMLAISQSINRGTATQMLPPPSATIENDVPLSARVSEDPIRTAILSDQMAEAPRPTPDPEVHRARRKPLSPDLGWIKASLALGVIAVGALCALTLSSLSKPVEARNPVTAETSVIAVPAPVIPPNAASAMEMPAPPHQETIPAALPIASTNSIVPSTQASAGPRSAPKPSTAAAPEPRKRIPTKIFVKPR